MRPCLPWYSQGRRVWVRISHHVFLWLSLRYVHWRKDAPATLVWTEANDGGDPANEPELKTENGRWMI